MESGIKMFSCKTCEKVFKTCASLSNHKYRFHKSTKSLKSITNEPREKGNKQFSCKICDIVFKTGSSLSSHKYRFHKPTRSIKSRNLREAHDESYGLQKSVFRMVKHQQLIKLLSKALLDGFLPMTSTQVKLLTAQGDIVRVLADGTEKDRENVFEDESNDQILKNLFEVFRYSLNNIF